MELLDNGILVATYKRRMLITLDMAREIVRTRLDFVGREPRPVLIFNQGVTQIDKPARRYVSSGDGVAGISAAAIVSDRLATNLIMSIIFKIEKPPIPARMFRHQDKAMTWLETYL